jgi:hypothetical protein
MSNCWNCGSSLGKPVLSFGSYPIAGYLCKSKDDAVAAKTYPLEWYLCGECTLFQQVHSFFSNDLINIVYPQQLHTYATYPWLAEYINSIIAQIAQHRPQSKQIVEIGCNDGSALGCFKKAGYSVLGVEPGIIMADACLKAGIPVINDFFTPDVAKNITAENGRTDVIILRHVFEHVLDVPTFVQGLLSLMHKETLLIIEVPSLLEIVRKRQLDGLSHPHVNCFSISSLEAIFSKFGLSLLEVQNVPADGGSILTWWGLQGPSWTKGGSIQKVVEAFYKVQNQETFRNMQSYFEELRNEIINLKAIFSLEKIKSIGYGAGAKGACIANWFNLKELFDNIIDRSKEKTGMYMPGTGQRVVTADEAMSKNPDAVFILAPTHLDSILKNEKEILNKAIGITILPSLALVSAQSR